jgi:phage tail sheath protein FI
VAAPAAPAVAAPVFPRDLPSIPGVVLFDHFREGTDGASLSKDDLIGANATEVNKKGMYALEKTDIFNMLYIPPFDPDGPDGFKDLEGSFLSDALQYCMKRRAVLLVDPPKGWQDPDSVTKNLKIEGLAPSNYAAMYFPRLLEANPLHDNRIEAFSPCPAVAGVIARTDLTRGVWKAPAGIEATLQGISGLSYVLTDNENGLLNPHGVNCLRSFDVIGDVVWGARTMRGDDQLADQWKYLPIRRLALFIEESLYRSTKWVVFEPNDEPLWSQIRLNIGVFMHDLFRQGAFQGQSPSEAYLVKCDATTTTQSDRDRGIVNIVVGFAPLKPAEFVILTIKQLTGDLAV